MFQFRLLRFVFCDNMRCVILLQILFFGRLLGFAYNVTFKDYISQSHISSVAVYDVNGNLVGHSDMGGNINLTKGQEYHVSHICYESKTFVCNDSNIVYLYPASYTISDVVVTAKMKKYYHFKAFFRSIEHVDSVLKYYMDGVCEFFIDTKTKKVKRGNVETCYFMSKRQDVAQNKRGLMINDRYMGLPYIEKESLFERTINDKRKRIESGLVYADTTRIGTCEVSNDKKDVILSLDVLYPKSCLTLNLFGYTQVLSKHNSTEVYRINNSATPSVLDLKSFRNYRHLTLTHKKENYVRDIDVEDVFFVVESKYTDTKEASSSERMMEDYKKYSVMYPLDSKIRAQLMEEQTQE